MNGFYRIALGTNVEQVFGDQVVFGEKHFKQLLVDEMQVLQLLLGHLCS